MVLTPSTRPLLEILGQNQIFTNSFNLEYHKSINLGGKIGGPQILLNYLQLKAQGFGVKLAKTFELK
jgi:hypothetical protein